METVNVFFSSISRQKQIYLASQDTDDCAKEIRLTYYSYASEYYPVSDSPITFNQMLPQGMVTDLVIQLKLTTGDEIEFWKKSHKTSFGTSLWLFILLFLCTKVAIPSLIIS